MIDIKRPGDTFVKNPEANPPNSETVKERAAAMDVDTASPAVEAAIYEALDGNATLRSKLTGWRTGDDGKNRIDSHELANILSAMLDDPRGLTINRWKKGQIDTFDVRRIRGLINRAKLPASDPSHIEIDKAGLKKLEKLVGDFDARLARGEIMTGAYVVEDNPNTHVNEAGRFRELCIGQTRGHFHANAPKIGVAWSLLLDNWKGGDAKIIGEEKRDGYSKVELEEWMHLGDTSDGRKASIQDQRMLKRTVIEYNEKAGTVRVQWSVYDSDDQSMLLDDGYIEFKLLNRGGKPGQDLIQVTTNSYHDARPKLEQWLVEGGEAATLGLNEIRHDTDGMVAEEKAVAAQGEAGGFKGVVREYMRLLAMPPEQLDAYVAKRKKDAGFLDANYNVKNPG